jgi:hypothetical protein
MSRRAAEWRVRRRGVAAARGRARSDPVYLSPRAAAAITFFLVWKILYDMRMRLWT